MLRLILFFLACSVMAAQGTQLGSAKPAKVTSDQIRAVSSFQLLSSTAGWILADRRLLWTASGGTDWEDITPRSSSASVDTTFFLDERRGWAFLSDSSTNAGTTFSIAATGDGGATWSHTPIAEEDAMLRGGYGAAASLSFADAQHGWVLIHHASSSAASIGSLYATADGGSSWTALAAPPIAGQIRFISALDGWLTGGVRHIELYATRDGGRQWTLQTVDPPQNLGTPTEWRYALPSFEDSLTGSMPVEFSRDEVRAVRATYFTADGGHTWKLRRASYNRPAGGLALASSHGRAVIVFTRRASVILFGDIATRTPAPLVDLPESAVPRDIQFVDELHGWLLVFANQCSPPKMNCMTYTVLLKTEDGGNSFVPLLQRSQPAHMGLPIVVP